MKRILNRIAQYFYGKKKFQPFFEKLQYVALRGQNYYNTSILQYTGEKKVVDYLLDSIGSKEIIIFDCGAHHGEYIDLFDKNAKRLQKTMFHLFEPQKACVKLLSEKYKDNLEIKINHVAVGKYNEENIKLYTSSGTPLFAITFEFDIEDYIPHVRMDGMERVDMINLYDYCLLNEIEKIDILKLDVEGMEYDCLESLESYITNGRILAIQFEYSFVNLVRRQHFHDFWKLLSPYYDIHRIGIDGVHKISKYHMNLEIAIPINFLALIKTYS